MKGAPFVESLPARALKVLREDGFATLFTYALEWTGLYRRLLITASRIPNGSDIQPLGFRCTLLKPSQVDDYLQFRPDQQREEVERHLDDGNLCVLMLKNEEMVACVWAATGCVWVEYIHTEIFLKERTAYTFDLWVTPELRGQRISDPLDDFLYRSLVDLGCILSFALLSPSNRSSRRRGERRKFPWTGEVRSIRIGPWHSLRILLKPSRHKPLFYLSAAARDATAKKPSTGAESVDCSTL